MWGSLKLTPQLEVYNCSLDASTYLEYTKVITHLQKYKTIVSVNVNVQRNRMLIKLRTWQETGQFKKPRWHVQRRSREVYLHAAWLRCQALILPACAMAQVEELCTSMHDNLPLLLANCLKVEQWKRRMCAYKDFCASIMGNDCVSCH